MPIIILKSCVNDVMYKHYQQMNVYIKAPSYNVYFIGIGHATKTGSLTPQMSMSSTQ